MVEARSRESMERHLGSPGVSVVAHLTELEAELAAKIRDRRKVYLDTRYWVFLRDAALGQARRPEHVEILELLHSLVQGGRVVCPVSDVCFMEMTAQTDVRTRRATAELWDALSMGIALGSMRSRARTELVQFVRYPIVGSEPVPLQDLVWTRPCFVLGPLIPTMDGLPSDLLIAMQKSAIDELWKTSFVDMAEESSVRLGMKPKNQKTAERINEEMRQYQHEIPTIKKAFGAEVMGQMLESEAELAEALLSGWADAGHSIDAVPYEQLAASIEQMQNAIVNACMRKPQLMTRRLPTICVGAICHAAVRFDKTRKFSGNFLRDIHHAAAGLPYHDVMLTERPLQVLLASRSVAVDETLGCKVISDEVEALAYLRR